ncbi:MAG: EamA family transporter [Bacteroidetes bacterium]|nr:EamA family transporter [Bacteroidota bacterium]
MTIYLLVFIAAALHAYWNFLAKTIPSGVPFIWLVALCATVVLSPFVAWYGMVHGFPTDWKSLVFLSGTGVLHLIYFWVLQRGYQQADLSVVYPLARGTGPLFATLGAVVFLQEKLSGLAVSGLCAVLAGVVLVAGLTNASWRHDRTRTGIFYGLTTGLLIAGYTVWDGYAVKMLALSPLLVDFVSHPFRVVSLTGNVVGRWPEVRAVWKNYRLKILTISVLSPLGFIMVLYAMQTAPVHFVAPARELSIVFGVLLGGKLLLEENFRARLTGSVLILAGIVMLGWKF